jgi:hypothetical protein
MAAVFDFLEESTLVNNADSIPLIASMQVSGHPLPRNARFSKTPIPIFAYLSANGTGKSPSHEAYIRTRQAIHVAQVNDGQDSGASDPVCSSLDAKALYLFNSKSKDREDSIHVCSACLYSGLGLSAARSGLFMEMMASFFRIIKSDRWYGCNEGVSPSSSIGYTSS